jgi:hypothetical protein
MPENGKEIIRRSITSHPAGNGTIHIEKDIQKQSNTGRATRNFAKEEENEKIDDSINGIVCFEQFSIGPDGQQSR